MYQDDSGVNMVDTHIENEGAEINFSTRVGNDHKCQLHRVPVSSISSTFTLYHYDSHGCDAVNSDTSLDSA
jgi:hypothetical protein